MLPFCNFKFRPFSSWFSSWLLFSAHLQFFSIAKKHKLILKSYLYIIKNNKYNIMQSCRTSMWINLQDSCRNVPIEFSFCQAEFLHHPFKDNYNPSGSLQDLKEKYGGLCGNNTACFLVPNWIDRCGGGIVKWCKEKVWNCEICICGFICFVTLYPPVEKKKKTLYLHSAMTSTVFYY